MFYEIRAHVFFEREKKTCSVPLEFIKNFKQPYDPDTLFEVFWTSNANETPLSWAENKGPLLNIDEALKDCSKKEKAKLVNSTGYYYAKILVVKDNLKELEDFLDSKEGRRLLADKESKENSGKERQSENIEATSKSKAKTNLLVAAGASSSLKRIVPNNTIKDVAKKRKRDVTGFDIEDEDDDITDATLISEEEHLRKVDEIEKKWRGKYDDLKKGKKELQHKYDSLLDDFLNLSRGNRKLNELLCDGIEKGKFLSSGPAETFSFSSKTSSPALNNTTRVPFYSPSYSPSNPPTTPQSVGKNHLSAQKLFSGDTFKNSLPQTAESETTSSGSNSLSKTSSLNGSFANSLDSINFAGITVPSSSSAQEDKSNDEEESDSSPKNYSSLTRDEIAMANRKLADDVNGDKKFIRNIAGLVFSLEVLAKSSVTGAVSNNTKGRAKPRLDPAGLEYIHKLLEETRLQGVSPCERKFRLGQVNSVMACKIRDVNTGIRKSQESG